MTTALEVREVDKFYGKGESRFQALSHVTLALTRGESVAILGKSGSGKSTLMHLLALMDTPTSGTITVNGRDTASLRGKELDALRNRTFGFVFQQFFLNGNSTVLDNVMLPLKIAGVNAKERKARSLAALEAVELADKANSKANNLSGGQKQRVVIARALVNNPEIIFADEPTGNLDSTTGRHIEDLLFSLNKDKGITLIVVTHDADIANRCDRQVLLRDGAIVGEGTEQ